MGKAKIIAMENGPFRVQHVKRMIRARGEAFACKEDMYLCRCGESSSKPYCDGTHNRNGFTGENQEGGIRNITVAYRGRRITIYDNRNICSHAGYCTAELPTVFSLESPWIEPNGDSVEKIIAICKKCPSGALSYAVEDGERRFDIEEGEPVIRVIGQQDQGPYAITGKVKIEGQLDRQPEAPNKMTLCRCGRSKNKPYCNGDHRFTGAEEREKNEEEGPL